MSLASVVGVAYLALSRSDSPAAEQQKARPCFSVSGDRIRGTDLISAGLLVDPELDLGPSPVPSVVRTIQKGAFAGACFVQQTKPLNSVDLLAAMLLVFGEQKARIQIVDFSPSTVPESLIKFTKSTLVYPARSAPEVPVLWRGRAVSGRRSIPIWALVRLSIETKYVEAVRSIEVGHIIEESDVATKNEWVFPLPSSQQLTTGDAVGMAAIRKIMPGERISHAALIAPTTVRSGEQITVRVESGANLLKIPVIADQTGRRGETIFVRNQQSGKRFRARITGPGQASVVMEEGH